ncbi:protein phosphatase regulator [Penicillium ochrochloron]
MTRPQMIRADTLDLQDHDTPSAKDHTKQPEHPNPLGGGRPAPHQELSIRHAEQDSKSEILNGPASNGNHEYRDGGDVYGEAEETDDDIGRNGEYDHEEDGDLADGESDDLMDDDMMDKLSSSPSIDDEDIDFEFVYALHNFIATVDGQANAAKGDTMVLLDDSNSYWWLVRVVKDGSIGYLPAEHIETPTERLARLNKHRNVDLSATMLGDNSEKSKNPLKKAMRRRNAKTVNFAPPTYIEASDVEYSTDEEDEHGDFFNDDETVESEDGEAQEQNEDIVVEPLRTKSQKEKLAERAEETQSPEKQEPERTSYEPRRSSEEFFDPEDSFFKDDTAEPKKISLTPNLLRDESSSTTLTNDWKDAGRGSFESIDKSTSHDKSKDDKKRKDKKPGMLSGLFKRKDKKNKSIDDDVEEPERSPAESAFRASPQPKTSSESLSPEQRTVKPQRQTSNKLQKQPPSILTSTSRTEGHADSVTADSTKEREIIIGNQTGQSIRRVTSRETDSRNESRGAVASPISQRSPSKESFVTPNEFQDPFASPVDRPSSEAQWREPYESTERAQPSVTSPPQRFAPKIVASHAEPRSQSPDNYSPIEDSHIPIAAPGVTKEAVLRAQSISPISPPSSPEVDVNDLKGSEATNISLDTLSVDTPTWSDASLRSYLDEENDIRDLFIIVHDKSNIPPAGPEHPVTGRLFKEESKRLKEMNNQLDEMLVKWMSQRKRHSSTTRSVQSPTA